MGGALGTWRRRIRDRAAAVQLAGVVAGYRHSTGELVAVRYGTDVSHYCGGLTYWYGRRVMDRERDCIYGEVDEDVPMCDEKTSAR